jgi:hypothetical protein
MLGYVYNAEGYHGDPVIIPDKSGLYTFLACEAACALVEGREIRITDRTGDDMLLHIEGGRVVWAGGGDVSAMEATLREAHKVGMGLSDKIFKERNQ